VAGLVGAGIAVLIGVPALRVQGLFLAVVTLSFAATVQSFLLNPRYFAWLLPKGFTSVDRPYLYQRFNVQGDVAFYYVCLVVLALTYVSGRSIRASRAGRSFISVRDNVRAAQSYGMSAAGVRLSAFALSGFYAAVAGALFAYKTGAVDQTAFPLSLSIDVFIFAVIGGLTSLPGALLGAVYFVGLEYFGPKISFFGHHFQYLSVLGTGAGVLLLLLFFPGGLIDAVYRLRDRVLRRIARRHDLIVPSLLADRLADAAHGPSPEEAEALSHAEVAVEEVETFADLAHVPSITCPQCGQRIPVSEATEHEHFSDVPA
jgi:branched-chain amino acid transport system permease protein